MTYKTADVQAGVARAEARPRVLVIEDDFDLREMLCTLFEANGYTTECANDGLVALAMLRARPAPDVILLDLDLPVMDGWQFNRERVRETHWAKIPLVVISAAAGPSRRTPYIDVAAIVEKPFEPSALLRVVRDCIDDAGPT